MSTRHERVIHHRNPRAIAHLAGNRLRAVHRVCEPVAVYRMARAGAEFHRGAGCAFIAYLSRVRYGRQSVVLSAVWLAGRFDVARALRRTDQRNARVVFWHTVIIMP